MLTIIIIALVVGLLASTGGVEAFLGGLIFGGGFGFLLAIIIGLFAGVQNEVTTTNKVYLQNINDGSKTQGTFFLGTGSIESLPTFSWYEETEENSFKRKDVLAESGTVHLLPANTKTRPYYIRKTVEDKNTDKFFHTWYVDANSDYLKSEHYDFYVPRGTITQEYKLDAQ